MTHEASEIDILTDSELLEFISDLDKREMMLVQRMLIQAEVHEIPMRARACEIIMRTAPSVKGRRAEQIVEALQALRDRDLDPDQAMGLAKSRGEDGGGESRSRSNRSIFDPKRWAIGD